MSDPLQNVREINARCKFYIFNGGKMEGSQQNVMIRDE